MRKKDQMAGDKEYRVFLGGKHARSSKNKKTKMTREVLRLYSCHILVNLGSTLVKHNDLFNMLLVDL